MVVDAGAALAMRLLSFRAAKPPPRPDAFAVTYRGAGHRLRRPARDHRGNGCDRDPRRQWSTWLVAQLLRDAQVNTIWEGLPDNILC